MNTTVRCFLGIFSLCCALSQAAEPQNLLFKPIASSAEAALQPAAPRPGPQILRRRFATVNFAPIAAAGPLTFNLFEDVRITVDGTKLRKRDGIYELAERLPAKEWGQITMAATGRTLRATIHLDHRVYEINPVSADAVAIDEIDPARFPTMDQPVFADQAGHSPERTARTTPAADEIPTVTVLVVNPNLWLPCILGQLNMQASNFQSNLDLAFSFDLQPMGRAAVTSVCVDYIPVGGDLQADLNWVTGNPDVAKLRSDLHADLVTLVVPSATGFCGRGWYNDALESDLGFSVVVASCATANFALAHEIGHNMGMRHDRMTQQNFTDPGCNYGYCTSSFSTIMAYPSSCPGTLAIGAYSTPRTELLGFITVGPLGVGCESPFIPELGYVRADNQTTLLKALPVVANWY